jgi:DNA topoisomerase-1
MAIAQQLYEGLPLGKAGHVGLITYMRTDSTNVAASALAEARDYISKKYGNDFLPPTPRRFTKKVKGAQEAHEAIRPTSVRREPEQVKPYLNSAQLKLYTLIWQRMVSSQMAAAQIDTTTVDIEATAAKEKYLFRAAISVIAFPGFLTLYQEGKDEDENGEKKSKLPELAKGEKLRLLQLAPEQHFTQPPPRYTEATLIKALEEKGIGRPSTYAPILSLIQERGYVERRNGKLGPTELGTIVSNLLSQHFADIVNVGFTARMEKKLDQIASGELEWVPMLHEFYSPFQETIAKATKAIPKVSEPTNEICEKCGRPMVIKWGRRGKFMSCSGFPECKNARSIVVTIGVKCPQCKGEMVERKSKKGRTFYGCGNYPKCKFAVWDKPLPKPCPQCGGLLTLSKKGLAKCSQCTYEGEAGEEG